jgi:hypothetical protein
VVLLRRSSIHTLPLPFLPCGNTVCVLASPLTCIIYAILVVTVLAFLKSRRISQGTKEPLWRVLWDDGFQYYMFTLGTYLIARKRLQLLNFHSVTTTVNLLVISVDDTQMCILIYRALTTLSSTRLLLHARRVAERSSSIINAALAPNDGHKAILKSPPSQGDERSSSQSARRETPWPSSPIEETASV